MGEKEQYNNGRIIFTDENGNQIEYGNVEFGCTVEPINRSAVKAEYIDFSVSLTIDKHGIRKLHWLMFKSFAKATVTSLKKAVIGK